MLSFQETYYVGPMEECPSQKISKGKLPDRYRNQRRILKKVGGADVGNTSSLTADGGESSACSGMK